MGWLPGHRRLLAGSAGQPARRHPVPDRRQPAEPVLLRRRRGEERRPGGRPARHPGPDGEGRPPPGPAPGEDRSPTPLGVPVPVRVPGADGELGTADDLTFLIAQAEGRAEVLVEGRKQGTHLVEFDLQGVLDGFPDGELRRVTGTAKGAVVVRDPTLGLTITHPEVVRTDEEYSLFLTVSNTSNAPVNLLSFTLPTGELSGVQVIGSNTRSIATLPPGESEVVEFQLKSLRTGRVVATSIRSGSQIDPPLRAGGRGRGERHPPVAGRDHPAGRHRQPAAPTSCAARSGSWGSATRWRPPPATGSGRGCPRSASTCSTRRSTGSPRRGATSASARMLSTAWPCSRPNGPARATRTGSGTCCAGRPRRAPGSGPTSRASSPPRRPPRRRSPRSSASPPRPPSSIRSRERSPTAPGSGSPSRAG